jgi:probable phosphomutase (TIGR03848 family)
MLLAVPLLLFVRHGVTDATGAKLVGWTPGVHLSALGRDQAESIRDRLEGVPLEAIYSSPLERCRETAAPLAAARSRAVDVLEGLGEVRYGSWTNRSLRQLARTKLWRRVQHVPSGVRFPGGESFVEAQARAIRALERIAERHGRGAVAVFSHADVIKLLLAHLAGAPVDAFQRLVVDPASISAVLVGDGVPRVLRVNDTGSLADLAPRPSRRRNVGG